MYSEAQMKDCWEAGVRHGCDLWVSENASAPTETPDRDQYLSTVKPVEVMRWVKASDRLPEVLEEHYILRKIKSKEVQRAYFIVTPNGSTYISNPDRHEPRWLINEIEWLEEPSTPPIDKK